MKKELITAFKKQEEFSTEFFPDNYEPKLPIVFVLDTSSSMRGKGIQELNQGLLLFENILKEDILAHSRLEVAIITFDSEIKVARKFSSISKDSFPKLKANGRSLMIEGIIAALNLISDRKQWYKKYGLQYYRPFIILITDGAPWPDRDLKEIPQIIKNGMEQRSFVFQAFGAGKANMSILKALSHNSYPPLTINGYELRNLFKWLAPSISKMISKTPANSSLELDEYFFLGDFKKK